MSEIKKGDRVRVTEIDEVCGFWFYEMNSTVGMVGTVMDVANIGGGDVLVGIDNGQFFYYPPWVIDPVKEEESDNA